MKKHFLHLIPGILAASLFSLVCGLNAAAEADTDGNQSAKDAETQVPENMSSDSPVVFFTSDISAEGMMAVYEALGWKPDGNVAVKLSTGEPPASNYLDPQLIKDVVEAVDGTIVECNTAYGGSRSETAMHYQVAEDHGFTEIADFQILDENGSMTLPVEGGSVLTENYVGAAFADYDSYLVLSHFKGHAMAGYGGASLVERIESRNGLHTLEHAEEIGLGSRTYDLVNIDE